MSPLSMKMHDVVIFSMDALTQAGYFAPIEIVTDHEWNSLDIQTLRSGEKLPRRVGQEIVLMSLGSEIG